jgi:peptide/nickel transport system permease protein
MTKYIIKRILQAIPLLILITIITFLIINLAPGDPAQMFINPEHMNKVDLNVIRHNLGLDKPLYIRYFIWLGGLLKGDLGISFFRNRPVLDLLMEALPNTIILSVVSILISTIVAIPAGMISALKRGSVWDYFFSTISFIGISIPAFWFGLMLLLVFGANLQWFPIGGMRENYEQFVLMDRLRHIILPAIVLGTGGMATDMRYMRSAMLEVINQDYIRTARSKGLSEKIVIWRHAFRNALLPLITLFGFMIPGLISGAAITESIFAWPGIGRIVVEANFTRDYPIIMGELVFVSVLVVLGSLIADVLYAIADPRIKYD